MIFNTTGMVIYNLQQCILTKKMCFSSCIEFYFDLWSFQLPNKCPFWPYFYGKFCNFFKCLPNFKAYALQLELNKVEYTNFAKFQLQSMSSKIEGAFEKTNKQCFYLHFTKSNLNIFFFGFSHKLFFKNNSYP